MSKLISILTTTLLLGVLSTSMTSAVLPECKVQEEGEIPVIGGHYYLIDDFVCVRLNSVLLGPFAPSANETDAIGFIGTVQLTIATVSFPAAGFGLTSPCQAFLGIQCSVISQQPVGRPDNEEYLLCLHDADYRFSLTENGPPVTYSGQTIGFCPE